MSAAIALLLSRLTEADRAALERLRKPDGSIRKTAPKWREDPHAWAAWQAIRTAMGWHGEFATFTLLMLPDDARATWDRVSEAAIAVRREIAARIAAA